MNNKWTVTSFQKKVIQEERIKSLFLKVKDMM